MSYIYPFEELNATGLVTAGTSVRGEVCAWRYDNGVTRKRFEQYSSAFGTVPERMIRPHEQHTDVILTCTDETAGYGVTYPYLEDGIDGLITDVPGLLLTVSTADCVPVFILDPVRKAIGMVHSGWRGTALEISVRAIEAMGREYGTSPEDLMIGIGPHICGDCYEVGSDVWDAYAAIYTGEQMERIFSPLPEAGKYLLNMYEAICFSLDRTGVPRTSIHRMNMCTYEDTKLCSWRREHIKGNFLLNGIILK